MHLTVVLLVSLVLPCPTIAATSSTSRSYLVCTSCRQPSPRWCGTVWYFCAKACMRAVLCALPSPFQTTTPMGTARWVTFLCQVSHLSVSVPGESLVCAWWVIVFVCLRLVSHCLCLSLVSNCLCFCLVSHLSLSVCVWWVNVVSVWWVTCLCLCPMTLWVTFVFAFHCLDIIRYGRVIQWCKLQGVFCL